MSDLITAIVLAAGKGSRMKSSIQKQFMRLGEKPVLYYSLKAFQDSRVNQIILVTGKDDIEYCKKEIIEKYGFTKVKDVVAGGRERYESVACGLQRLQEGIVLIHDGARPCIDEDIINRSIDAARTYGACSVGMPVKDTIKIVDDEQMGVETPNRSYLWQVQTPQTFQVELIQEAFHKRKENPCTIVTDDTMMIEFYLHKKVKMIEGSYRNIKITTPEDIEIAKVFLGINKEGC